MCNQIFNWLLLFAMHFEGLFKDDVFGYFNNEKQSDVFLSLSAMIFCYYNLKNDKQNKKENINGRTIIVFNLCNRKSQSSFFKQISYSSLVNLVLIVSSVKRFSMIVCLWAMVLLLFASGHHRIGTISLKHNRVDQSST